MIDQNDLKTNYSQKKRDYSSQQNKKIKALLKVVAWLFILFMFGGQAVLDYFADHDIGLDFLFFLLPPAIIVIIIIIAMFKNNMKMGQHSGEKMPCKVCGQMTSYWHNSSGSPLNEKGIPEEKYWYCGRHYMQVALKEAMKAPPTNRRKEKLEQQLKNLPPTTEPTKMNNQWRSVLFIISLVLIVILFYFYIIK